MQIEVPKEQFISVASGWCNKSFQCLMAESKINYITPYVLFISSFIAV